MSAYYLAHNVYFCRRGDRYVFLDLHADKYSLLDDEAARALRGLMASTSLDERSRDDPGLARLLVHGLLTQDAKSGRPVVPTRADVASESLAGWDTRAAHPIGLAHLLRFLFACSKAALQLRWCRLESIVDRVRARRTGGPSNDGLLRSRYFASIFMRLRPLFPRDFLCLFDSLALLEFLAMYEVFPKWFFGVRLEPWAAHCWLEEGGLVLDDDVEGAAGYTPVLIV